MNVLKNLIGVKKMIENNLNESLELKCGDCSRRKFYLKGYQQGYQDGLDKNHEWIIEVLKKIIGCLESSSYYTMAEFDDGYCINDSREVIDLDVAIGIIEREGGFCECWK